MELSPRRVQAIVCFVRDAVSITFSFPVFVEVVLMSFHVNRNLFLRGALSLSLACCLVALVAVPADAVGIIYSEDFTGTDGASFNGNTTPINPFGIPVLESYGDTINARINVDRLQMDDGGANSEGLSFGGTSGRFNWATAPFAQSLIDNGLSIKFDARTGNGGDFISLGFGSFSGVPSGGANAGFGAIYGYARHGLGLSCRK